MDEDLIDLDRPALVEEVRRLRAAVREHRDSSGHELCWHHPKLWRLLPETTDPEPVVPAWPQFLRGCVAYRESLDRELPGASRSDVEAARFEPKITATSTRAIALGAVALAAGALGTMAIGALAIGALAIGRVAVGGLALKKVRAGTIAIDELMVGRVHIRDS